MNYLLLIDGDMIACRAAGAVQKSHYDLLRTISDGSVECVYAGKTLAEAKETFPDVEGAMNVFGKKITAEPLSHAIKIAKDMLSNIQMACLWRFLNDDRRDEDDAFIHQIYVGGDSSTNFRYKVATTKPYKGHRGEKPIHTAAVTQYLVDHQEAIVVNGYETDDAMGIAAMRARENDYIPIIITNDKDLNMIPGLHYNPAADPPYFREINEVEAMESFYRQVLTGDPSDNIPGLPMIGKSKAKAIFKDCEDLEQMNKAVLDAYMKYTPEGIHWQDYLKEQSELLWIKRKEDDNAPFSQINQTTNS